MPVNISTTAQSAALCLNRRRAIAACFVPMELCRARQFKKKEPAVDEGHIKPRKWGWLILFTSSATLVCCVIPIVLVSLGMGAAVAALYTNFPFLTFMGLHKEWTFVITALILALAAWMLYRPNRACPADPVLAKACNSAHKWNIRLFWVSVAIWCISFFAAYLFLSVTKWLGL